VRLEVWKLGNAKSFLQTNRLRCQNISAVTRRMTNGIKPGRGRSEEGFLLAQFEGTGSRSSVFESLESGKIV